MLAIQNEGGVFFLDKEKTPRAVYIEIGWTPFSGDVCRATALPKDFSGYPRGERPSERIDRVAAGYGKVVLVDCTDADLRDEGLQKIAGLPDLVELFVTNCKVTDASVRCLDYLHNLVVLSLEQTSVSDDAAFMLGAVWAG